MHSIDELRRLLDYDPATGSFTWRVATGKNGRRPVGTQAGHVTSHGYRRIWFGKTGIFAHRLAWAFVYGVWPPGYLDHINGDPLDNRIANLRIATNSQNQANRKRQVRSRSPLKGVSALRGGPSWQARIKVRGKDHFLGTFPSAEEAHAAYMEAARRFHGEFARAA